MTKERLDWKHYQPTKPAIDGIKVFKDFDLGTIARYIDWGPFFIAWEMPGRFPEVLTDKVFGEEATRLLKDAQKLLQQIIDEKWFTANGVIGFWPALTNGKDTIKLQTEKGEVHLESLRQQLKKAIGQPTFSLADFIMPEQPTVDVPSVEAAAPAEHTDYMGAFAVTIDGARKWIDGFAAEHDEYNKILVQILADRLVEAFAECLHERVRKEYWGYEKEEQLKQRTIDP